MGSAGAGCRVPGPGPGAWVPGFWACCLSRLLACLLAWPAWLAGLAGLVWSIWDCVVYLGWPGPALLVKPKAKRLCRSACGQDRREKPAQEDSNSGTRPEDKGTANRTRCKTRHETENNGEAHVKNRSQESNRRTTASTKSMNSNSERREDTQ